MEVVRELERITRQRGPPSPFMKEAEPRQAPVSVALTSNSHLKAVIQAEDPSVAARQKRGLGGRRQSNPVGSTLPPSALGKTPAYPDAPADNGPEAPTSLFHKSISPEVNLRKRSIGPGDRPYMRSDTL